MEKLNIGMQILTMSFSQPFLLPMFQGILKCPKRGDHPLVINKSLALVASKITEKSWLSQAFYNKLLILTLTQGGKVQQLITTPVKKGSSWCYRKQIDPFQCPINYVLCFGACLYEARYVCRLINLGFAHRATF